MSVSRSILTLSNYEATFGLMQLSSDTRWTTLRYQGHDSSGPQRAEAVCSQVWLQVWLQISLPGWQLQHSRLSETPTELDLMPTQGRHQHSRPGLPPSLASRLASPALAALRQPNQVRLNAKPERHQHFRPSLAASLTPRLARLALAASPTSQPSSTQYQTRATSRTLSKSRTHGSSDIAT